MSNPEPNQNFLFSRLTPGREGAQCAFSARALSYIFHGWAHYTGPRKLPYGKPDNGVLYSIPFEKLGLFWCRLWEQLWKLNGTRDQGNRIPAASLETAPRITCPPPFIIERAKHGKRPQRYDGVDNPTPLIEILYNQQELGMHSLFDIRPYMVNGKACPSHYKTEVHAVMPYEVRESLIKDFNETERKLIEEIDEIVRHLGVLEIRALGTHESSQETMRDIQFEYEKMRPIVLAAISKIEQDQPFTDDAQEILEFVDEAYKKSHKNQVGYAGAHDRFLTDLKTPLLRQAFENCQESAADIWKNSQIEALASVSERDQSISKCMTAIAYFAAHALERNQARSTESKEMEHHWNEGLSGLRKYKILTIPTVMSDIYKGDSHNLKPEVRNRLLELVRLLLG
jgi:hypothetical protein